jgi:hypothetical protein
LWILLNQSQEFAMKLGILGAAVVLALPLSAMAQSLPQKKADLEEALRVQQFICNGIADVSARGGSGYAGPDLVRCRVALEAQRADYQRFMAEYSSAHPALAPSPRSQVATNRTALADVAR